MLPILVWCEVLGNIKDGRNHGGLGEIMGWGTSDFGTIDYETIGLWGASW